MASVPRILANSPNLGPRGRGRASVGTFAPPAYIGPPSRVIGDPGADAAAVSGAGLALSRGAASFAGALQRAEEEKRRVAAVNDAARAQADLELEFTRGDLALSTVTDPNEYLRQRQEQLQSLQEGLGERITNPDALALLQKKLPGLFAQQQAKAYQRGNTLFKGQVVANLDATVDARRQLAAGVPLHDDQEYARHYQGALDAIAGAVPVIGPEEAGTRARAVRESFVYERARRHKDFDPEHFLAIGDRKYQGMDPDQRNALMEQARTRVDALEKARTAALERWFKRVEEEDERERRAQVDQLESDALAGRLTLDGLETWRQMRRVTGEDYRRLHKIVTTPSERASDPAVAQRIGLDVQSINPRTTEGEIDRLVQDGRLNLKDGLAYKGRLRETREGLATDERAKWKDAHAQAEQEIRAALGIVGLLDRFDPNDERQGLYFLALQELRSRSRAYQGNEDPLQAGTEIAERMRVQRERTVKLKAETIQGALRFPTRDALEANRAFLGEAAYLMELRKFSELDRALAREAPKPQPPGKPLGEGRGRGR